MANTELRIALCLYGNFNNRLDPKSGVEGFNYIKRTLLDRYPMDVFIDTTDTLNYQAMVQFYKPWLRSSQCRDKSDFSEVLGDLGILPNTFEARDGFRTLENSLAFFLTRKNSIGLMSDHAKVSRPYDIVITCRFDLGQLDRVNGRRNHRVSEIGFNPALDMNYLFSAQWDQHNSGYADQWFFSNQTNIEILGGMFDRVPEYFSAGSEYFAWLSEGITDSNLSNEFSSERFARLESKAQDSVVRPTQNAVDNHLLHKYFLVETGLYLKSRFTSDLHGIAQVLYTHSDYSDIWPVYFGETAQFLGSSQRQYVLVDKVSAGIPEEFTQVVYDDKLSYTDRLRAALEKVPEKFMLFQHEDMFLYSVPKTGRILSFFDQTMSSISGFDYLRLIRATNYIGLPFIFHPGITRVWNWASRWIFSIQPSIWKVESFIELLDAAPGLNIWEFEVAAQKLIRKLRIKSATVNQKSLRRGKHHWDSAIFPYVATAIVKGKWNLSEYPEELESIFHKYQIQPNKRGVT